MCLVMSNKHKQMLYMGGLLKKAEPKMQQGNDILSQQIGIFQTQMYFLRLEFQKVLKKATKLHEVMKCITAGV